MLEAFMKRPRLGTILLQSGVIDEAQLKSALAYQRRWGMPLGRALVEKRLCTPQQLLKAFAKQTGLPVMDLDKQPLGPQQSELLTQKVAQQYRVVPVRLEGTREEALVIAMAAPAPLASIDAVRSVSRKRRVVVYLATDEAIGRAIGRIYRGWTQAQHPSTAPPVSEANPSEAVFERSGEHLGTTPEEGSVLLYGWTDQAGSTLNALLLSQSIAAQTAPAAAVLSCRPGDVVIAPFSAIEELQAEQQKIPGRVIVVSKTPSCDLPKARRAGAWGLLTPPFDSRHLAAVVQRCQRARSFVWAT
jgi:type IV pilus assembly protein PilB